MSFEGFNSVFIEFESAGVGAGKAVGVGVGKAVAVGVGKAVAVGVGKAIGVGVGKAVGVGVGKAIGVGVGKAIGVGVGKAIGVGVGNAVGVGAGNAVGLAVVVMFKGEVMGGVKVGRVGEIVIESVPELFAQLRPKIPNKRREIRILKGLFNFMGIRIDSVLIEHLIT